MNNEADESGLSHAGAAARSSADSVRGAAATPITRAESSMGLDVQPSSGDRRRAQQVCRLRQPEAP